eukprot:PITA_26426
MTTEGAVEELISFENSYTGYELTSSVCAVIFVTLVLVDVWKAFGRKATWIPGQALVLSALTIQFLLFIDHLQVSRNSSNQCLKDFQWTFLVWEQLLADIRRVMICVFIAYLLPGIVCRGLKSVWGDVGALALIVIAHMAYEAYFLVTYTEEGIFDDNTFNGRSIQTICNEYLIELRDVCRCGHYRVWLIPSYIALSLAMILLVVLLSCAVIAGKTIRNIMSQKVPSALYCCCSSSAENRLCENVADHVLKSWIVARASQPDYIMARSVFCAFAGVVVTVCDVLLLVKWKHVPLPRYALDKTVYAIQSAFVVVGSMVVVFRWFTAVLYFPRDLGCFLYLEDFWTRRLVQQKQDLRRCRLFLSLLLTMLQSVQKLVVFLSKACWFLPQFVFGMIRPFIMRKNKSDQFSKYEEALETIRMPGEKADSLWRANKSAFEKTENNLKKGIENGKSSCKELISLIEHKTGTPEEEPPTCLEEEKQFKAVGKNSWKMRAVSLIHLIIYFCDEANSDMVNVCIEAYIQASCFMDMVDRSDPETKLAREAADNEFNTLQNVWKKHRKMLSSENSKRNRLDEEKASNRLHSPEEGARSKKLLIKKMREPLYDNMTQLRKEEEDAGRRDHRNGRMDTLHDSKDLKAVAAKISLYKIWKVTIPNPNPEDAIRNLRCLLANIISCCLEEEVLDKALIKNCNKWAQDGNENEIFKAASIAGKAIGVRQQIREGKSNDAVRTEFQG